ncbi:MAG: hypothetical protein AB7R69_03905 [Candidatus Babeliales bacterium]
MLKKVFVVLLFSSSFLYSSDTENKEGCKIIGMPWQQDYRATLNSLKSEADYHSFNIVGLDQEKFKFLKKLYTVDTTNFLIKPTKFEKDSFSSLEEKNGTTWQATNDFIKILLLMGVFIKSHGDDPSILQKGNGILLTAIEFLEKETKTAQELSLHKE